MKLDKWFYQRNSVKKVAKDLLGKVLYTRINNVLTGGIIVETEAYSYKEKGCHAYNNLRTARTEVMFREGGYAYIYLCYGIHNLFNVVTNAENVAEAVLVRALEPVEGLDAMCERRKVQNRNKLTSGPGKLTKALGIERSLNNKLLWGNKIWVEDNGIKIASKNIKAAKRIGIEYAEEDTALPWRFIISDNPWISSL